MFIRPTLDLASETEGARLRVRDPETMTFLADEGEEKPDNEYWLRRMVEGGVEVKVSGRWPKKKADDGQDAPPAVPDAPPSIPQEIAR